MARALDAATLPRRLPSEGLSGVTARIGCSAAMVVAVAGVLSLVSKIVNPRNLEILFILPVLVAAVLWGLAYALGVSIASAAVFEFYFLPPIRQFSFKLSDLAGLLVFMVCGLVVSELANRAHSRARLSERAHDRIAEEQSALRRVATLVAREVPTTRVFDAVAAEVGKLIGATSAYVSRYESDGGTTILAGWHHDGEGLAVGRRYELDPNTVSGRIQASGRPERVDYAGVRHDAAAALDRAPVGDERLSAQLIAMGIRSSVGAPIMVGGRVWGAITVATTTQSSFPEPEIARLADFTELVSTAISNSAARAELEASRSRIVAAGDAERRRIERDIHDGAQQRLVALALELRAAELSLPPEQGDVRQQLDQVARELGGVLDELRELSRGIHPSLLSDKGLKAALRSLARRSPIPVELDITRDQRYPEAVEVAAYYVASEALVNASKHAGAAVVRIQLDADDQYLVMRVIDDGTGGADPRHGSGLVGLADRVGALGGRSTLSSPLGGGTTITIELPIDRAEAGAVGGNDPAGGYRSGPYRDGGMLADVLAGREAMGARERLRIERAVPR